MLHTADGGWLFSATSLTDHLACAHLTVERRRIALGERPFSPRPDDPHAELVRERGIAHEIEQFSLLTERADGPVVDLGSDTDSGPPTREDLRSRAEDTLAAMRDGAALIYQGTLLSGRWQGRPDFLRRIDHPDAPWGYAYEVLDTKLSRQVKPHVAHQLCLYTRLVGEVQGVEVGHAWVILGNGRWERVEVSRFGALHRRATARLERVVDDGPGETYPEPTAHCAICRLAGECAARRRSDDHLSLVAGARRDQRKKLVAADLSTLTQLAELQDGQEVPGMPVARVGLLHHQARLQRNAREGREPVRRHLAAEANRGYARLPRPSPGDVFFDLEGDPYATPDGGIEYLWGWVTAAVYDCLWAHTLSEEREAFQRFVDVVEARRREHPDMHVFHYAPHEASTLRRLSIQYATCEDEIDAWLRSGVLVDLFAVVRQGLQVVVESYSLKKLEPHHGYVRTERTVREGGGSIIAYEQWLATGDQSLLDAIREYNREDCESTRSLRDWLADRMRPEAARELGVDFDALVTQEPQAINPPGWLAEVDALIAALHDGLPTDPTADDPDQAERRLLGHLLLYHHRENKPQWWQWFDLCSKTPEELVDERDAVGLLTLDPSVPPAPVKRSLDWTLRFPEQEVKLSTGSATDPTTGDDYTVVCVEDDHLILRRGKNADPPEPRALIGQRPPDPAPLRSALVELARSVLAGDGRFRAARSVLRRELPQVSGVRLGPAISDLVQATLNLRDSHLAVQGPPGTGKTYAAARMIVTALREGRRIAATANSHAAIQNLLRAVEEHADDQGVRFVGAYNPGSSGGNTYDSPTDMVAVVGNTGAQAPEITLLAGTAWLLSRPEHEGAFDLLFIDEAGQMALAAAAAAGRCATSIVMLGDPQQLPQVNQATHPDGSGASVLGHLLQNDAVIAGDRGVLLDTSWRMHPEVCSFISRLSYDDALTPHPDCARQHIACSGRLNGAGLRVVEVAHDGRSQDAPEEAQAIADLCRELLQDGRVTGRAGTTRPLTRSDILIVAPYNLAVSRLQAHVPDGVRVGTVDRFQGQEAPVVFFALTCSSDEDVPRGLDFLFDRNRLNVAISRAQCLAVLVHSPTLLDASCTTLEQMQLADALCGLVEAAALV